LPSGLNAKETTVSLYPLRVAKLVPLARFHNLMVLSLFSPEAKVLPSGLNALVDFSGYLAIDEVYDGPFCILSVVDNRRYNRLAFRVLDHDPTEDDVRAFLSEFKGQLDRRGWSVFGITTDGSSLYPKVLKELWPTARHQICEFHVIKEITKAVLHALAKLRKEMTAKIPKQQRGRPRKEQRGLAWLIAWHKQQVADLFEHRYLFVRHHLSAAEQKQLRQLTCGRPELRTLRKIMDEVYRLFDRRCQTQTALKKLQRLRRRVRQFKKLGKSLDKLKSPTLEKALEFLDDQLLGATSNAVERANRRFRKAQNSIYRVRTKEHLEQRLALDMHREQRAPKRQQTVQPPSVATPHWWTRPACSCCSLRRTRPNEASLISSTASGCCFLHVSLSDSEDGLVVELLVMRLLMALSHTQNAWKTGAWRS
jgi:Transposase